MTMLNRTLMVMGREYKVPISYEREGGYYTYKAPSYKITVSRRVQAAAWKEFDAELRAAVERGIKNRL